MSTTQDDVTNMLSARKVDLLDEIKRIDQALEVYKGDVENIPKEGTFSLKEVSVKETPQRTTKSRKRPARRARRPGSGGAPKEENTEKVLKTIKAHSGITTPELIDVTNLSEATIHKCVKVLMDAEQIRMEHPKKNAPRSYYFRDSSAQQKGEAEPMKPEQLGNVHNEDETHTGELEGQRRLVNR